MSTLHPQIDLVVNDVIKSAEDKRKYRGLQLKNGLKVLIISDESTDKCSAAMDVHIGHLSDPPQLQGLAHFCEHMLFLGTEKYPEENAYSKFLASHGGSSNAFTSYEHTNYYFDVAPDHFHTALDMFSQFFLSPLFTESATDREVNAVNSENDKNLQSDAWRLSQMEKALSRPGHDFGKFGTGNKFTLDENPKALGIDVRAELLKFHSTFYSSNIMALSVLGKESLDSLTDAVIEKFSSVENKNVAIPEWLEHPYGPDQLKYRVNIVPVMDIRELVVLWPVPDLHQYWEAMPGHYLGQLIGHEGRGSLLSALKAKHWVNSLMGGEKSGAKGFQFFTVEVDLTEEGQEHVEDIVMMVYQYIEMLRKEKPQLWVFEEGRDLNSLHFRFKDKERPSSYTSMTAKLLQKYPVREVLSGPYMWKQFRPDLIENISNYLRPDNMALAVISKKYEGCTSEKEKWYGTDYTKEKLSTDKLEKWAAPEPHEELRLPSRNVFVPVNFDLCPREAEPVKIPRIVKETPLTRCWYKEDTEFLLPKACVTIEMTSPLIEMSPTYLGLSHMFSRLFQDALVEYSYDAEIAGLKYHLQKTTCGMQLSVNGYNDKLHVLLERLMDKFTSFHVDPKRFEVLKEEYVRSLQNFKAEQPTRHAGYYLSLLTREQCWTNEEALESVDEITVETLQQFVPALLSRLHLEILIYGNVTAQRAVELAGIVEAPLLTRQHTRPLPPCQVRHQLRNVQLPDGSDFQYQRYNEVHPGSCLYSYYQCGIEDTHANMLLEMFCQIIHEPCFDILRTKEQLGYIVHSGPRRSSATQALVVIVQSDKSPNYVDARVENFISSVEAMLEEMSEEAYAKHVQALITQRLEKPKNMSSQNSVYWTEIISEMYNFDRDAIETEHVKTITKADLIKFLKELIAMGAPSRRKLSVHVISNNHREAMAEAEPNGVVPSVKPPQLITDHNAFKRNMPLYPLPSRYHDPTAKSKL